MIFENEYLAYFENNFDLTFQFQLTKLKIICN